MIQNFIHYCYYIQQQQAEYISKNGPHTPILLHILHK